MKIEDQIEDTSDLPYVKLKGWPLDGEMLVSIAISLKRIADALEAIAGGGSG